MGLYASIVPGDSTNVKPKDEGRAKKVVTAYDESQKKRKFLCGHLCGRLSGLSGHDPASGLVGTLAMKPVLRLQRCNQTANLTIAQTEMLRHDGNGHARIGLEQNEQLIFRRFDMLLHIDVFQRFKNHFEHELDEYGCATLCVGGVCVAINNNSSANLVAIILLKLLFFLRLI